VPDRGESSQLQGVWLDRVASSKLSGRYKIFPHTNGDFNDDVYNKRFRETRIICSQCSKRSDFEWDQERAKLNPPHRISVRGHQYSCLKTSILQQRRAHSKRLFIELFFHMEYPEWHATCTNTLSEIQETYQMVETADNPVTYG